MACDLHIHSTASDGGFTPAEVVRYAHKIGLTCISLTDHDTLFGISEAEREAEKLGMDFIPGIEMTAVIDDNDQHILAYYMDPQNEGMIRLIEESYQFVEKRLSRMVKKLNNLGFELSMEDVKREAGDGSMGRPHVAGAMVRKGYIDSPQEAFDRYIGSFGGAYVSASGHHPSVVYKVIREAGGVPVLAHPGLHGRADMMKDQDIVMHRDWGVLAIEIYHPRHDDYMVSYYKKMASKYKLGITGGSDCHGSYFPNILMDRKFVPDWVAKKFKAYYINLVKKGVIPPGKYFSCS